MHRRVSRSWKLAFRQTAPAVLPQAEWRSVNSDSPTSPQYSALGELEQHRAADGQFRFRLVACAGGSGQQCDGIDDLEWSQTSNPMARGSAGPKCSAAAPEHCTHVPSACLEGGDFDNDCCAGAAASGCQDGFVLSVLPTPCWTSNDGSSQAFPTRCGAERAAVGASEGFERGLMLSGLFTAEPSESEFTGLRPSESRQSLLEGMAGQRRITLGDSILSGPPEYYAMELGTCCCPDAPADACVRSYLTNKPADTPAPSEAPCDDPKAC